MKYSAKRRLSKPIGIYLSTGLILVAGGFFVTSDRVWAGNSDLFLSSLFSARGSADLSESGSINVTVRDSRTGRRLAASLRSISIGGAMQATTIAAGKGALAGRGRTDIEAEAPDHHSIKTYFFVDGNTLDVTIHLDPVEVPDAMRSERLAAEIRAGETLFHGYVYDDATGAAVGGARVFIERIEGEAITDENGYFKLLVRTPPIDSNGDMPAESDLVVLVDGLEKQRRRNVLVEPGVSHFILDLKPDETRIDATHKFRLSADEQANAQSKPPESPYSLWMPDEQAAVVIPASIRVGFGCATATTCTSVNVYSLDTYVRNGLNDEWIASWNANSLKAGAIAFRSYGAYHVNHPRTATYDICSTTSCQVMDTDTHANSDSATAQTVGSVVTNAAGTDFLRSEYSAENNLAPGCPDDGSTGRPADGWPCLADPVDVGTTYFGHGRGMCQWGTQRWSINQGKDFVWIVNHYYNANGNPSGLRNGVLQLGPETLLPPPELTEPGNQTAPGTTVSTFTPTFVWQPVAGADGYSLYVSKFNGSTYDLVFNSENTVGAPIAGTSYRLPSGILVAGGEYRWNMSAHIPVGYGTPNTFRNYFRVGTTTSISGRVTSPTGLNIRNAVVTITDSVGNRRTATTSSFGIYSFGDVTLGEAHTVSVATKRYRFTPQVIQVTGNLANVDFTGLE